MERSRRLSVRNKTKADHVYEKWKIDYINMDKKSDSIRDNFDQLFYALFNASTPWEEARDIADDAIKHHLPTASTAKFVWTTKKRFVKLSFKDWTDSWETDIRNKGLASFYVMFPLETEPDKPLPIPQTLTKAKESSIQTDDELNTEDLYNSSKIISKERPWFFGNEDDK